MEATNNDRSPLLSHHLEAACPWNADHRRTPANSHCEPDLSTRLCINGRGGWCLLTLGTVMFLLVCFLAVEYGPDLYQEPLCLVQNIYIPALDKAASDDTTTNIFFHLSITNRNYMKFYTTVHYDTVNLTLYYGRNPEVPNIGNISIPKFDLGFWPFQHAAMIETFGVPWEDARVDAWKGKTAVFRVQLEAKFMYTVNVNGHGKSMEGYYYLLSNAASVPVSNWFSVSVVALLVLQLLSLL